MTDDNQRTGGTGQGNQGSQQGPVGNPASAPTGPAPLGPRETLNTEQKSANPRDTLDTAPCSSEKPRNTVLGVIQKKK
jgi:hypothetical protein